MKKTKQFHKKQDDMSSDQILQFLEDFRTVTYGQDKKTKMISIRIPENILQTFKLQAQLQQRPYQSVIVELMRLWLKPEPGQVP